VEYYLVMFKPTPRSDATVVGCLRFQGSTTYDQRQELMTQWAARKRPHKPALVVGESMWLAEVNVENAEV
jgi:hypothetical protein